MRIIAGSARGIPLAVPKSVTRPTADRTREALFSILADRLSGASVLDLYAGSGALGLEALSRGAESAWFVEQNRAAAAVIEKNAAKAGLSDGVRVRQIEVAKFLKGRSSTRFDIVFADPPYKKNDGDYDHASYLLGPSSGLADLIADDGIFVLEDWSGRVLVSGAEQLEGRWELLETRKYGATSLHFFRPLRQV